MQRAWQRVRRNRGKPGMDGMTIDEFPAFAREHWERIRAQLKAGTYRPAPVRRVYIPKPDGSQRPLGVPTVLDRVIQQAIAQVLTPLYDGEFSEQTCFGISHTSRGVLELDEWIRRRVRLYYWKQWSRPKGDSQPTGCPVGVERSGSNRPRARRRNLIKLGINPKEVHKASRSRKGYWRMSDN